eukprot:2271232-Pleurochrysis_carterae.AAC.2
MAAATMRAAMAGSDATTALIVPRFLVGLYRFLGSYEGSAYDAVRLVYSHSALMMRSLAFFPPRNEPRNLEGVHTLQDDWSSSDQRRTHYLTDIAMMYLDGLADIFI